MPSRLPTCKFRLTPGTDYLTAYRDEDLRGNLRNLYPFLDEDLATTVFDPDNLLYGPNADPSPGYLQHDLRVSLLTPVSSFGLGADVVPGSVQVLRNGVAENRYEFDAAVGVVSFLTEIAPDDRLIISFRRKQSLAGNGDLLFVWGNTIPLGDAHTLQVASGLRWNVVPGTYTEEAYKRTGSALVSAGLQGEVGPLRYEVSAAAGFTNPDTTGRMRLLGMEGQGREISLSESTAWPAAPPANTSVAPGALDAADNEGYSTYKDLPYETGSKPGPYVASERPGAGLRPGQRGSGWAPRSRWRRVRDWLTSRAWNPFPCDTGPPASAAVFAFTCRSGKSAKTWMRTTFWTRKPRPAPPGSRSTTPLRGAVSCGWAAAPRTWETAGATARTWTATALWTRRTPARPRTWCLCPAIQGILRSPPTGLDDHQPFFHPCRTGPPAPGPRASPPAGGIHRRGHCRRPLRGGAAQPGGQPVPRHVGHPGPNLTTLSAREVEEWAAANLPAGILLENAFSEVAEIFHPYGETQKVLELNWRVGRLTNGWREVSRTRIPKASTTAGLFSITECLP